MTVRRVVHAEPMHHVEAPEGRLVAVHVARREGRPDDAFEVLLTVAVAGGFLVVTVDHPMTDAIAQSAAERDRMAASVRGKAN